MRHSTRFTLTLALAATLLGVAVDARGDSRSRDELTPTRPVVCGGNEDLHLRDRLITTDGDAIVATGNCDVYLVGSVVEAGGIAVRASNNAEVYIVDSEVTGERAALSAINNAEIHFQDSEIRGRQRSDNFGELVDRGGNRIDGFGGEPATGRLSDEGETTVRVGGIELSESGIRIGGVDVVEIDEESVSVGGGVVVVDEEGVSVAGDGVVIDDETVRVGGDTILIDDRGVYVGDESVVVEDDGTVRILSGGDTVVVESGWREGGTRYGDTERVLVELGATTEGDRIRVDLAGDVLFDFDSSAIRPEAASALSKVAHVIRRRAAGRVTVVGHTDSLGSADYNQRLSEERARAVIRWLAREEGIPVQLMAGAGAGAARPVAYNTLPDGSDNPQGRARNRRVEIRIATGGG